MRNRNWLVLTLVALVIVSAAVALARPTRQEFAGEKWEYAALAYSDDSVFAFTSDMEMNAILNAIFDAMDENELNIITALNLMGVEGWEYIDVQGNEPALYLFKRPL